LAFKHTHFILVHQVLVLNPSCIPEKVGVNQKGVNQTLYSHKKKRLQRCK